MKTGLFSINVAQSWSPRSVLRVQVQYTMSHIWPRPLGGQRSGTSTELHTWNSQGFCVLAQGQFNMDVFKPFSLLLFDRTVLVL